MRSLDEQRIIDHEMRLTLWTLARLRNAAILEAFDDVRWFVGRTREYSSFLRREARDVRGASGRGGAGG